MAKKDEWRAELERQAQSFIEKDGGEIILYAAQSKPDRRTWHKKPSLLDEAFQAEVRKIEESTRSRSKLAMEHIPCDLSSWCLVGRKSRGGSASQNHVSGPTRSPHVVGSADISLTQTNRIRSSHPALGAAAPYSCCTRRSTGRHPWAWFPAWQSHSAGRSARIQERWRSSLSYFRTVEG